MERSEEHNLAALLAAADNGDVASTTKIWRGLTSTEQEGVVFTLLGVLEGQTERTEPMSAVPKVHQESGPPELDEQAAIEAEQTELILKPFEDLRGLTASGNDAADGVQESPDMPIGSTEYWSQWR